MELWPGRPTIELPSGAWRNVLTGESVRSGSVSLDDLLGRFPVALLERTR
ncbi:MAG: hypothetical protein ABR575_07885 [Actinomycetota bacterium]